MSKTAEAREAKDRRQALVMDAIYRLSPWGGWGVVSIDEVKWHLRHDMTGRQVAAQIRALVQQEVAEYAPFYDRVAGQTLGGVVLNHVAIRTLHLAGIAADQEGAGARG